VTRQVLVCVHDVTPRHTERLREIDDFLDRHGVSARYSMLVVPDFWREWPLQQHAEFGTWLRGLAERGVEMLLHGFYHRDETPHRGALARWKATTMTASEGEFLGLERDEALRRIADGRAVVEDVLGSPVTGFVAPAWLYSDGTRAALRELGFREAEDHLRVWNPQTGRVLVRGPVLGYASRDAQRIASSLAWSTVATRLLRPVPVTRFAIHPHDFDVGLLRREIDRALGSMLSWREPVLYRELSAA
jgi:predicted deacetylase